MLGNRKSRFTSLVIVSISLKPSRVIKKKTDTMRVIVAMTISNGVTISPRDNFRNLAAF